MAKMGKRTFIWLILIVLFAAALRLIFFSGIGASDDLLYTSYAYEMSKNEFSFPANHHGTRLGLLYPVSIFYRLFGVNEFSSNAFVFLTSIAGIVLIFYFGKIFFNEKVGLSAAFLLSFFPLDLVFATKLLSDAPSSFFLSLCVFLFLVGEKSKISFRKNLSFFMSGIAIGIAYLIRETALLIVLFFGFYAIFYKKIKLNYFLIFFGFMIIFALESIIFQVNTGDFLFRYHSITSSWQEVIKYSGTYRGTFPLSLFYFPYIIFTNAYFGLFYPFIIIAIFYSISKKEKKSYPFILWFLSLFLYLSFGTTNFLEYRPFAAIPRVLTIVTLPALILLSHFLSEKNLIISKILKPLTMGLLLLTSIGFIYLEKSTSIDNLKSIYPSIKQLDKPIYTDPRSKLVLEYLSGYSKEINILAFNIQENDKNNIGRLNNIKDSYILINHKMLNVILEAHPFINFTFDEKICNQPKKWIIIKNLGKEPENTILYYAP